MNTRHVKFYRLSELLDMTHIQTLADSNFQASGLPMTIIDATDNEIFVRAGWPGMCTKYHRANPISSKRCVESDNYVVGNVSEGEVLQYKCKNGLWHIVVPIFVMGQHLGTLFLTQFFFEGESIDREHFIRQAKELGFDRDGYLAELDWLPIFTREKVDYILAYYKAMAKFFADMAEQSVNVIETKKILSESEEKYRTLVHNIQIGIFRYSSNRLIQANPAMAYMFGCDSVVELMKVPATRLFINPQDRNNLLRRAKLHGFIKDCVVLMQRIDGSPIWCSLSVTAQLGVNGNIQWIDGVIEDITERKRLQDAQRELSEKDHLTAIYNRRKLFDVLTIEVEKAKRYKRPLALIMFDLDHFKMVNDMYGHDVGDIVLKKTAELVASIIRKSEVFARYGGEEFIIVCTETLLEGAVILADKIRQLIEQHNFPVVGRITISVGVTGLMKDTNSALKFIKYADEALYAAKKNGRNRVETAVYSQEGTTKPPRLLSDRRASPTGSMTSLIEHNDKMT
jgi:diguanylate cyclase (GGDEF)-like protein/PAS domain S-box-containing protein